MNPDLYLLIQALAVVAGFSAVFIALSWITCVIYDRFHRPERILRARQQHQGPCKYELRNWN